MDSFSDYTVMKEEKAKITFKDIRPFGKPISKNKKQIHDPYSVLKIFQDIADSISKVKKL